MIKNLHSLRHRLSPTGINYRANIWALKSLDVRRILSVSAVGSLKEEHAPGDFILKHIDRTVQRVNSFFANVRNPVCANLNERVLVKHRAIECLSFRWWNLCGD